jgi:DNA-binding Xre family transcriptional regulator
MTISYKKLWIMLAEREMSKAELRRQAGLSPATFTKLRRNQSVSMEVLLKIAETLDCNIGDLTKGTASKQIHAFVGSGF